MTLATLAPERLPLLADALNRYLADNPDPARDDLVVELLVVDAKDPALGRGLAGVGTQFSPNTGTCPACSISTRTAGATRRPTLLYGSDAR
jgi:hypothetical protein